MKSVYAKMGLVVVITALSVLFIPGLDDLVESVFQIVVLVASS